MGGRIRRDNNPTPGRADVFLSEASEYFFDRHQPWDKCVGALEKDDRIAPK
jgi:hypothetical protein